MIDRAVVLLLSLAAACGGNVTPDVGQTTRQGAGGAGGSGGAAATGGGAAGAAGTSTAGSAAAGAAGTPQAGAAGASSTGGMAGSGLIGNEDLPMCLVFSQYDNCVGGCAADPAHQCPDGYVCCSSSCNRSCKDVKPGGICGHWPCQLPKDCDPGGTLTLMPEKLDTTCAYP